MRWKWGDGFGDGEVSERHEDEVERTINGHEVRRNRSAKNPALVIRQDDGQIVVKLQSEVERLD